MPAKSKQQQKFFGVVKAMQKGDIPKKGEAGKVAKDMSKKEVDKYAGTKHKGLPKKVKKETMKISDIKKMVREELQALNEVKPFADDKIRKQYDYPKGNKDGLVYLATNDKRYPTEIVLYNQKRDVFHFLYSHNGTFKPGSTSQQTVPRQGFNSTHYVMPFFEDWEEDFDYEKGFYENKVNEDNKDGIRFDMVMPDEAYDELFDLIGRYVEDPDDVEKELDMYDNGGFDSMSNMVTANLDRDKDYIAWKKKYGIKEGKIIEAKMTPAKVQKAQRELVATIQLLKKNFPMYKAAKESGNEKKLAKHRDIAVKLTKKKKDLELALDRALGGLYQDAELELKEVNTGNKINKARAKAHFKQGEKIAVVDKNTGDAIRITDLRQLDAFDSKTHDFAYITEAAPRMKKDPYVEKLRLLYKDIAQMDRQMKIADSSRYSHVRRDWDKALLHVAKLTNILNRKGPTIPEGINEALPKFKTPYEAYSWIMNKRGEAMDIETEMLNISGEIHDKYKDMEQEAEAGGGPIADRYGKEIEALENKHKELRAQFAAIMAEIDEYDQNY